MATKKTTVPEEEIIEEVKDVPAGPAKVDPWEKVELKIGRDGAQEEMIYISVNDYSCTVPRGKTVMVPRFIKEEWERSQAAKEALAEREEQLLDQSK